MKENESHLAADDGHVSQEMLWCYKLNKLLPAARKWGYCYVFVTKYKACHCAQMSVYCYVFVTLCTDVVDNSDLTADICI